MTLKFFNWRINIKLKHIDADKRILFLANNLIQELINGGYDVRGKASYGNIQDMLHFNVYAHKHSNKKYLSVESINRGWSVNGEYTGNGFEKEWDK